jgi:hypothetical protein
MLYVWAKCTSNFCAIFIASTPKYDSIPINGITFISLKIIFLFGRFFLTESNIRYEWQMKKMGKKL